MAGFFTLRGLLVASPKGKGACGRPTKYTDEIIKEFCRRISIGRSVHSVCRDEDMPSRETFYKSIRENDYLSDQYREALKLREDYHFDEMLEIADMVEDDGVKIQKAKLMIDTRKWVLSRMNPKKYGDKAGEHEDFSDAKPESIAVNIQVQDARKKDT